MMYIYIHMFGLYFQYVVGNLCMFRIDQLYVDFQYQGGFVTVIPMFFQGLTVCVFVCMRVYVEKICCNLDT